MKTKRYTMYFSLILLSITLNDCKSSNIQQQMNDTLMEIYRVQSQFYQQSKALCEFTTDKYSDNYSKLMNYIPRFLENVYIISTKNNKQIKFINELFNLNETYNNSEYSYINRNLDDVKNSELLHNVLVSKNNHQVIQYVNEIFSTRKKIDNLRKIFENLESQNIQQQYYNKHKIIKEKN